MLNYDKNSKKIVIPEGTKYIPDSAFQDFKDLEEVILPSSIEQIGKAAFSGCSSLKKINLPEGLKIVEQQAFANCKSLEEVTIPSTLEYFSYGLFSYCHNLKTINCHDSINYIDDFALYNCRNLTNFSLPKKIKSIGIKAMMGCNSIKEIDIPKSLDNIELSSFALMSSLEKIIVEEGNPRYVDDDELALFDYKDGYFVQYAINNKNEEYILGYYPVSYGKETDPDTLEEHDLISYEPIYNVGDYAFAESKYLKKIEMSSVVESVGPKTFLNCPQLKTLDIYHVPYGEILILNIHGSLFKKKSFPFEKITIGEGVTAITDNTSDIFKNAREISLPSTVTEIGSNSFNRSKHLKEIVIPEGIRMIGPLAFHPNTMICFSGFINLLGKDFNMLETKTSDNYYVQCLQKDNIKIFSFSDGTYYVTIDDYEPIKINRNDINSLSDTSYILKDEPDKFINYLYDLLSLNADYNNMILKTLHNQNLKRKFEAFISDIDYVTDIAVKKNQRAINDILEEHDLDDEILFNGILMRKLSREELTKLIENMNLSLDRFFKLSHYFDPEQLNGHYEYSDYVLSKLTKDSYLFDYCNLLEKYEVYDRALYEPKFVLSLTLEQQEKMIRVFDSNIKRLFMESGILKEKDIINSNLKDLFKFAEIMGTFSEDERLRQKACNFIVEKIFSPTLGNGEENNYQIIGDNIHRIFDEIKPRKELDPEFILFFIENYKELIDIEKTTSGFISRVYNSFREISQSNSSNRGSQKHLKVTVKKCKDFFLMNEFSSVSDDDKELAELLGKYYSNIEVLKIAKTILEKASHSPRNIFTDSDDASEDIKGFCDSGFFYEWLPKQSLDNLILGKYCGCCAHLTGAGAGIMQASMVLDNCQNLVIRNELGKIIAKATLSLNREQGYGVFNTIEASLNYHSDKQLNKIYDAFMSGSKKFIESYNNNHPDKQIDTLTIGSHRNIIANILEENGHGETTPLSSTDYSKYGYALGDEMVGGYGGDHTEGQKLLYKRPIKE